MATVAKFFLDPTCAFALSTLLSVLFVKGELATKTLVFKKFDPEEAIEYLTDTPILVGVGVVVLTLAMVGQCEKVARANQMRASWFLWNAAVFHIMMDGCSGGLNRPALMGANYRILDNRFRTHIPESKGGPHHGEAAGGFVVVMVELLIMSVLCIITCVGIMKNKPWHHEMQALMSAVHLFGVIMFVVPEFLTQCQNMAPIGEKSCLPELTPFTFFYYYFGVGANLVWVFVPLYLGYTAIMESAEIKAKAMKLKTN